MDFDSPDVEKDFPGLYASEGADGKSRKSKEESDYSEGDHGKKELLIGRRKEKKDKKDRGYAALEGESSHEEELDAKSPSKKKSKAFKFSSSKSKEKREKSRENKEKPEKETKEERKEKPEKEKENKKKDKDKKETDKKEKNKDKEKDKKKEKIKLANNTVSEEVLELGDVQPVFGVSVSLATERSRCHDGVELPLVVRDCIDYLQEEHSLRNDQIYKVEPVKTRLQHFKRLYNNRERQPETDELDMPTASGLLKAFLRELPEPILTTDLMPHFEEIGLTAQIPAQKAQLSELVSQLPSCNQTLLNWILLHFDTVIQYEKHNKLNAQSLAMLLSPPLQMSHRLLVALLFHAPQLFAGTKLSKYVPPITAASPKLPENPVDIQLELRKQESLLAQIHAEMNAGFVSKKREEQLWEVQRIITQLKRKLRSFEKRQERSMEDPQPSIDCTDSKQQRNSSSVKPKLSCSDDESKAAESSQPSANNMASPIQIALQRQNTATTEQARVISSPLALASGDGMFVDDSTGFLMVPKTHVDYDMLLRLQLENQELLSWKLQLQARITAERAEILRLKQCLQHPNAQAGAELEESLNMENEIDYDKVIENYIRENALLEHKKQILAKEIFEERREYIALQVEFAMKQF